MRGLSRSILPAFVLAGTVAATLLSGCSGSATKGSGTQVQNSTTASTASTASASSSGAPTATGSSTPTATDTAGSAGGGPSKATMAGFLVRATDLPAGWTTTPASADDPNEAKYEAELAKCIGLPNGDAGKVLKAEAPDFNLDPATISSSASSYKAQTYIDADIATLKSPKAPVCFQTELAGILAISLPTGAKLGKITVTIDTNVSGAPSNVVAILSATVGLSSASGVSVPVYVTSAYITGHLCEVELDFQSTSTPVAKALEMSVITAVANRAKG